MYIDINLLQQKKKRFEWIVVGIILFVSALVCLFILFYLHNQEKNVEQQLESDLANEFTLRQAEQQNIDVSLSDKEQVESLVEWAEKKPVPTVFLLLHLSQSLPEKGFIKLFTYSSNDSVVTMTTQFESNAEAAYYLTTLKSFPYIVEAKLLTLGRNTELENPAVSETQQFQPRMEANYEIIVDTEGLKKAVKEEVPSS
ncbi:PilN domain-containing protein [Psychrobacillus sp. NPDC096426]|uniref:PilN domain-containing protein n=1 Tax=Psychrobacillus sp. NPDC096426 TaxID=3364491 RepID=UPI0037F831FA